MYKNNEKGTTIRNTIGLRDNYTMSTEFFFYRVLSIYIYIIYIP